MFNWRRKCVILIYFLQGKQFFNYVRSQENSASHVRFLRRKRSVLCSPSVRGSEGRHICRTSDLCCNAIVQRNAHQAGKLANYGYRKTGKWKSAGSWIAVRFPVQGMPPSEVSFFFSRSWLSAKSVCRSTYTDIGVQWRKRHCTIFPFIKSVRPVVASKADLSAQKGAYTCRQLLAQACYGVMSQQRTYMNVIQVTYNIWHVLAMRLNPVFGLELSWVELS
jgi:hypothetical protein